MSEGLGANDGALLPAAMGATFAFTESAVANQRQKDDALNGVAGGCAAGFLAGIRGTHTPNSVWGRAHPLYSQRAQYQLPSRPAPSSEPLLALLTTVAGTSRALRKRQRRRDEGGSSSNLSQAPEVKLRNDQLRHARNTSFSIETCFNGYLLVLA